jgi:hypothetical protein
MQYCGYAPETLEALGATDDHFRLHDMAVIRAMTLSQQQAAIASSRLRASPASLSDDALLGRPGLQPPLCGPTRPPASLAPASGPMPSSSAASRASRGVPVSAPPAPKSVPPLRRHTSLAVSGSRAAAARTAAVAARSRAPYDAAPPTSRSSSSGGDGDGTGTDSINGSLKRPRLVSPLSRAAPRYELSGSGSDSDAGADTDTHCTGAHDNAGTSPDAGAGAGARTGAGAGDSERERGHATLSNDTPFLWPRTSLAPQL